MLKKGTNTTISQTERKLIQNIIMKIKALQAVHHSLPPHLNQTSAITLSKMKSKGGALVFYLIKLTRIYDWDHYFQCSMGHNSERKRTRLSVLVFCRSSHGASHSCKVNKYITWTVIFNVQRPTTQNKTYVSCVLHATLCCFKFSQGFKKISETIFKL